MKLSIAYLLSLGLFLLPAHVGAEEETAKPDSNYSVKSGANAGTGTAKGLSGAAIGGIATGAAVLGIAVAAGGGGGGGGGSGTTATTGTTGTTAQ